MNTRSRAFNEIVAESLGNGNHGAWFQCVKNYLIAHDLWEVVDGSIAPPTYDEEHQKEFASWNKKNAAALHAIMISCSPESYNLIAEVSEAKAAWDTLHYAYNYKSLPQSPQREEEVDFDEEMIMANIMHKAVSENNWIAVRRFIELQPNALKIRSSTGQTALHVAAQLGLVGMLEELVRLVQPEYLEVVDDNGYTPLALAALYSNVRAAQCLVDKNKNPLGIATSDMLLPVTLAFTYHRRVMGSYLFNVTPLEFLDGPLDSRLLLDTCCVGGYFDVVLDLLARREASLSSDDGLRSSVIMAIANVPDAFPSGRQLVFWKRWIYHSRFLEEISHDIHQASFLEETSRDFHQERGLLQRLILRTCNLLDVGIGWKEIHKLKLRHAHVNIILSIVCDKLTSLNEEQNRYVGAALFRAAEEGIVEIVSKVSQANPQLILLKSPDKNWHTFFFAIQNRQVEVFKLIYEFRFRNLITASVDLSGNSMLHVVASLAPFSQLRRIAGAALQMQRELQWYKAVENVVPRELMLRPNNDRMKAIDLFKISHKELRDEGEKWMKDTATSCSLVGALLVTIMFAVAFTIPGGNNQNSGYPIFLDNEKLFMLFIVSDVLSLFSSTTSVLTFLGILTSRYAEEDFLESLPRKLIIGLTTLFLSIVTMEIAFIATILIMLQHKSHSKEWVVFIIILASHPVTIFVLFQFPLLVQMVSSTYGPSIFRRNVKLRL